MATFIYTARRSLLPGRIANQTYQLDIETQSSPRRRKVEKSERRAAGGATETLYHRADVEWTVTFEPVNGFELDALREFLDSTESGELFQMQIFSTEASFTQVRRADEGYEEQEFQAQGSDRTDYVQVQMTVRKA